MQRPLLGAAVAAVGSVAGAVQGISGLLAGIFGGGANQSEAFATIQSETAYILAHPNEITTPGSQGYIYWLRLLAWSQDAEVNTPAGSALVNKWLPGSNEPASGVVGCAGACRGEAQAAVTGIRAFLKTNTVLAAAAGQVAAGAVSVGAATSPSTFATSFGSAIGIPALTGTELLVLGAVVVGLIVLFRRK